MAAFAVSFLGRQDQAHAHTKPESAMSSNDQILKQLLSSLHRRFAIDIEQVTAASRLSDIGIDSLHLVDIMLDMEDAFGFRFESLLLPPNPSLEQITNAILREQAPE